MKVSQCQKNKHSILKYQKSSEKYKEYKKKYDEKYREANKEYARFRAIKCLYIKEYGKVTAMDKLATYLVKRNLKGLDLNLIKSPTNRK